MSHEDNGDEIGENNEYTNILLIYVRFNNRCFDGQGLATYDEHELLRGDKFVLFHPFFTFVVHHMLESIYVHGTIFLVDTVFTEVLYKGVEKAEVYGSGVGLSDGGSICAVIVQNNGSHLLFLFNLFLLMLIVKTPFENFISNPSSFICTIGMASDILSPHVI